ncbi:MAG: autotransporter-associated beta strand repeat-containing protein [Xanthomonadaceae bacterium]|nr:autotransporter-associated beta strand repeat-containing protein [Xanthomonadaceae bacterium]
MNRIYRLVWNRAKRVVQVVSELAGTGHGDSGTAAPAPRRHPLTLACATALGLALAGIARPAAAVQDFTIAISGGDISGATLASSLATGNVTILSSSGGTTGTGNINVDDAVSWNANTLTLTAANNIVIGGTGALTLGGTAGLTLNPATANGADAAVAGGTTLIDSGGRLTLAGSGTMTLGGLTDNGTFDISGAGSGASITSLVGGGTVYLGGNALTLSNASGSFGGAITDGGNSGGTGGSLVLSGGTLTLTGANTYTGGTTISAGILQLGNGGTSGSILGNVTDNAALVFDQSAGVSYGGVISGTGSLTQAGTGTLTLTGANTYTGGTTIDAGIVAIGPGGSLAATGAVTLANASGAGFDISAAGNQVVGALSGGGTTGGTVMLGGNTLTFGDSSNQTFGGVVGGTGGSLVKQGTGTETLTGTNTYTGGSLVNGGTLEAASSGALGSGMATVDNTASQNATLKVDSGVSLANYIVLNNGATLVNAGTISNVVDADAVDSNSGTATVKNLSGGSISGDQVSVSLRDGGTITNDGGSISASGASGYGYGVQIEGATGTVHNTGGASISGLAVGVAMFSGGEVDNTGSGSIISGSNSSNSFGVQIVGGSGTVTNSNGARIEVSATSAFGVGVALFDGGSVVNTGTGSTITAGNVGVYINGASGTSSTINNGAGALIQSTSAIDGNCSTTDNCAILGQATPLTLQNAGSIVGATSGVELMSGGSIVNSAGGLIEAKGTATGDCGSTGDCSIFAATASDGAGFGGALTLSNAGTIIGNVQLDPASANTVTLTTGGVIQGNLDIGADSASTLTLNGTGTQLYSAAVTGTTTFAGALRLSNANGAVTWVIDSNDLSNVTGTTIDATGTLQVGNGGTTGSIGNGNVADNGTLAFDHADAVAFAGVVSGSGALTQMGSGTLTLTGANSYSGGTTISAGTLQGDTTSLQGNIADNAALVFEQNSAGTFGGIISGNGTLTQTGSGTLTLDGDSSAFAGSTTVASGSLIVGSLAGNGAALGGNVAVAGGAILGGHGTIGGNVDVAGGAHLAPGDSIGTLTIDGNASFAQGSVLDYQFGAPGANFATFGSGDSVAVGGNLALNGATLNVADAGGMGPGLYNLFTYGGTLTETNGGLALGTTPAGTILTIQNLTSAKQINLLDATGLTLDFWNGNGLASATQMGGGSGTWSTTSPNWTDATGSVSAAMSPQPGFAIFGGAPGTVTVDNSAGTVSATGLQFASNGYTLAGGTLTLVGNGAAPIVRVGDGSAAGAGYTATISNVIAGSAGLRKTDLGTLVLTGANSYTGGTTIDGGTLSVAADGNLGAAGGTLTLDGGTLQVTGSAFHATTRGITLGSAGGGFDIADAGNTFTVAQALAGSGSLDKQGSGTLVLTGANTYTGSTTISAGTLQGDTTSLQGNIADNAALVFEQNGAGTFAGTISGSGSVTQGGTGVLTLTGANSYSGGTTISAGVLQLGNGGTTGAIAGDVLDDGTFAFDRSDAVTFAGVVSGSGALTQMGSGTLTLTGANSYSGGTTISAGTLQGDTASLQGNIADNAALVFEQNSAGTFAGAISGNGTLTKNGSGTLILSAANSYSGGTTINAGTLQGDTASLQGNIADNAALVFEQASDGTFSGALSGNGSFAKTGAGTLILDGNSSSFAGSTSVQAGTLEVGDANTPTAFLGGNVQVNAGGTLRGHGTIGGDVSNGGTLWAGGSIGTLTVQGNYTQAGNGVFETEATPGGQASLLRVGGTASLAGTALVLADSGTWAPRTDYTILTAAGGVTGQFASASSSLSFLDPLLTYTANAVNLSLQRNDISFASVTQTPNQQAVATVTNGFGFASPLYSALTALDAPTARHAFDQLSGAIHASTRTALVDDSRYVRDAINRHLLGEGDDAAGTTAQGVAAWASAWGHGGHHDGDGNAARLQADGSGLLVGADLPLGSDARLGAVLGHGQNSIRSDSVGSSAHVLGDHVGIYGSGTLGALMLRAGAVYAWQDVHSNRAIAFGSYSDWLQSEHHAQTMQAYVEGGYRFRAGAGQQLEPFVNVARVQVHSDALREGGGDAALSVAGNSAAVNTATLGLRDTLALDAAGGIRAHASLGWQQAWGDLAPVATARFVRGGSSFAVAGMPVARHAFTTDLGIDFKLAGNVSVDAGYLGQFAGGVRDQGARMSLTVTF